MGNVLTPLATWNLQLPFVHMKHFGREEPLMLKSTPLKVPAAAVAELVPSFTTTETVAHHSLSGDHGNRRFCCQIVTEQVQTRYKKHYKTKRSHFKQT
jgi:hypothetical protein